MKAALYRGIEDIKIVDLPIPKCGNADVLIKVEACAICGSDVRTFYKGTSYVKPNTVIGHEVVGVVVEKGELVTSYEIGDRLAVGPIIPCGTCYFCQRGEQYLCLNEEDFGGMHPGGFAEYMLVIDKAIKHGSVAKVPKSLSAIEGTLAEPLSSVYKAHELVDTKIGDDVVILGAGPIGCMHVEMARIRGARKIIQSEINEDRIKYARKFGADIVLNSKEENLTDVVMKETNGFGADVVICAAPSVEAANESLNLVKRGGVLLLFAGLPKDHSKLSLDGNILHYKDICVTGTIGFSPRHFHNSLDLITRKVIKTDNLITGTIPLSDIAEGFDRVSKGKELKLVVIP